MIIMSLEQEWPALRGFFLQIMDENKLDDSSVEEIKHYISQSEYEMAFDDLFINLMTSKCILTDKQNEIALDFGRKIELNHESIFLATFRVDFVRHINLQIIRAGQYMATHYQHVWI